MDESLFSPRDLRQMSGMGVAPEEAARQVSLFRNPPPFTRVLRPCRPGDGILAVSVAMHTGLLAHFDAAARRGRIGKLIPASGAATRMFKDLLAFLAAPEGTEPAGPVRAFFDNLPRFAFHEDLAAALDADGIDLDAALRGGDYRIVLSYLLDKPGLGYADCPKGLLQFHRYPEGPRTPFEEHLVEAAAIATSEDGLCLLHFTVSPEHQEDFERLLDRVRPRLEERYDCRFEVSFSTQRHSTDTLAVDPMNQPFRQEDGTLLFRPGGHGSLLENLNELGRDGWDVILLKNIDNVVPDGRKPVVHLWKRVLGGCLLAVRERIFDHLDRLEALDGVQGPEAEAVLSEAAGFLEAELSRPLPQSFARGSAQERKRFLMDALDRPLRVCGVVRNQGEPGGGPFWVESPSGGISPQIVETSQIDLRDPEQKAILDASTHFNPVDIACGLRDRHGRSYDLSRFVDPATVFISEKSHDGRPLKALERPGLWNGAMAGWNTVFVEVPDATFAPVKTVLDLLRPEHQ
ncbi:MAG TPA: DUF4301 family protein [Thermoanaerobaculia bacterium]|nr:DUF4301 family protein [Thermoanaerobaculia bacterium]